MVDRAGGVGRGEPVARLILNSLLFVIFAVPIGRSGSSVGRAED